jgi:hypothetical protein
MEYSGEGVGVYAEAKGEYTRQLCTYLSPALQKFFLELLDTAKEREQDSKKHLMSFQTLLEGISEWNVDKVQRETQALAMSSQCDYLEELLTAVFIAHTKVLSAIRLTNKQKKLQITIPKLDHFLHRTMTECARLLWSNTFLFATAGAALERQKNMRQIETLITEGVLQGVRSMLPVKSILREYLATDGDGDAEDGEDAEEEAEEEEAEEAEADAVSEEVVATGPTGPAAPAAPVEPTGPTGPAAVPTIVLNDIASDADSLFQPPAAKISTPPALRPSEPLGSNVQEMDDIPLEEEAILDDTEPAFFDMGEAEPLSIVDENGIEFEEL